MIPEITEKSAAPVKTEEITVTPAAAEQVLLMMSEKALEGFSLRVFVSGSGCSGLQYGMALDDKMREGDKPFQFHGMQLVVDSVSLGYMEGSTIDYVDDPAIGTGFKIDNPNSVAGCGCGTQGQESSTRGGCSGCA